MLTRPGDLADETLTGLLRDGWGVADATVNYLAVGFGSHHWMVDDGGRQWFLTIDDLDARRRESDEPRDVVAARLQAALSAAAFLADDGLEFVLAPIRSTDGTVLRRVDDRYAAAVYPFVDGRSFPYGAFLSTDHFDAVLGQVVRLHAIADPAASGAATDDLVVPHRDDLSTALDELGRALGHGTVRRSGAVVARPQRHRCRAAVRALRRRGRRRR